MVIQKRSKIFYNFYIPNYFGRYYGENNNRIA